MALERRCSVRDGQDVALDKLFTLGAVLQAFLEVVGSALALELEGLGLERSGKGLVVC